ncbi:carboxypeptidase Y [[Candida] anglica]|uniref:carboxypeptidase C n=1 Tax=[Candida] anglica TaxID=148631 RepID=A0ABP0EAX2_9ASCO
MRVTFLAVFVTYSCAFKLQNPFSNDAAIDTFKQGIEIDDFLSAAGISTIQDKTHVHHLMDAWKDILKDLGPDALRRKIDQYTRGFIVETPAGDTSFKLNEEIATDYEAVNHPKFSSYQLRVKESNPEALKLDSVRQFTGYLDLLDADRHFFYWFFESRNDPKTDPIILWLNGGPGCASSTGIFFELGPSSISADTEPVFNPHSWNSNASVIFLDQPAGAGYSYVGETGTRVGTSTAAAKDIYAFLELFFAKFPHFRNNKFHIAGESYSGHYIPAAGHEIITHKDRTFNLSSILIGNGIVDPLVQAGSFKPMACGEGGYKQVLTDEECANLDVLYDKYVPMAEACYKSMTPFACVPAALYYGKIKQPFYDTGLNKYDIRTSCEGKSDLCYPEIAHIDAYLDSDWVKEVLDIDPAVEMYETCSDEAEEPFNLSGDTQRPSHQYVAELLEHNVPVLLYSGDKDYTCNWLGGHMWSDKLDYSGQYEFQRATFKPFMTSKNAQAGEVKNYDIFTFLRVYDAGHMVPHDKPEVSLDFLNKWLSGDYSLGTKKTV